MDCAITVRRARRDWQNVQRGRAEHACARRSSRTARPLSPRPRSRPGHDRVALVRPVTSRSARHLARRHRRFAARTLDRDHLASRALRRAREPRVEVLTERVCRVREQAGLGPFHIRAADERSGGTRRQRWPDLVMIVDQMRRTAIELGSPPSACRGCSASCPATSSATTTGSCKGSGGGATGVRRSLPRARVLITSLTCRSLAGSSARRRWGSGALQ